MLGLKKYQELVIGNDNFFNLLKYEFCNIFNSTPGALGLLLRKVLYKKLFKKAGKNVIFGRNITLRSPFKIILGNNIIIDDNCLLDAKGKKEDGIVIHDNVVIERNSILNCKKNFDSYIEIGENTSIRPYCVIESGNTTKIGKNVMLAPFCYLIGASRSFIRKDISIHEQERESKGITIEDDVLLGAGVKVLDGIRIGKGSVIGAGAVVTENIPPYSIAVGTPARVIKKRK